MSKSHSVLTEILVSLISKAVTKIIQIENHLELYNFEILLQLKLSWSKIEEVKHFFLITSYCFYWTSFENNGQRDCTADSAFALIESNLGSTCHTLYVPLSSSRSDIQSTEIGMSPWEPINVAQKQTKIVITLNFQLENKNILEYQQ